VASDPTVGLCATCLWTHRVRTRRGSVFYRCGRADDDPRFPRYPALPRLACEGYEEDSETGEGSGGAPVA
jgi:hypothetical protein